MWGWAGHALLRELFAKRAVQFLSFKVTLWRSNLSKSSLVWFCYFFFPPLPFFSKQLKLLGWWLFPFSSPVFPFPFSWVSHSHGPQCPGMALPSFSALPLSCGLGLTASVQPSFSPSSSAFPGQRPFSPRPAVLSRLILWRL